jgi:hypothetical protein
MFSAAGMLLIILIPFLEIAGFLIPLLINMPSLEILAAYIGVPMLLAPLLYFWLKKQSYNKLNYNDRAYKLLLISYIISFIISLIMLYIYEVRTFQYYALVLIMSIIILIEIVSFDSSRDRVFIILMQISALCLNVIWGVTLKYYYFFGRTDVFAHAAYSESLLEYGYITGIFDVYKPFPLWHILSSFIYSLGGLSMPVFKVMFLESGALYFLIPIVVYFIATKVTAQKRIALLVAQLVSFYPFVVFDGMYSISRSIVPLIMLVLILTMTGKKTNGKFIISLFLTLVIIMYHTVSILFVLSILALIYIVQKIFAVKEGLNVDLRYLVLSTAMMVGYWYYFAGDLLLQIFDNISTPAATGILTQAVTETPVNELFNYLQYSILLLLIIVGTIYILRSAEFNDLAKVFSIIGLMMIPVTFPGPILLLNKLGGNFSIDRFNEYSYIFIIIPAAIGFMFLFYKSKIPGKAILSMLFALLVILSVSNDFVASDNPLIKRPFYTFYFTESDLNSVGKIADFTNGYVMTDYVAARYLWFSEYTDKKHLIEIDTVNQSLVRQKESDVIILRESELDKRPLKLYTLDNGKFINNPDWDKMQYYYKGEIMNENLANDYGRIYDSDSIKGYN